MIKYFVLQLTFILASFSGFAQNEQPVATELPLIPRAYYGCCIPEVQHQLSSCQVVVQKEGEDQDVLDITDPELSGLVASPNPTKGYLSVSIPPSLIGYEIQVIDMTGRFVGSPVLITGTTENLTIDGESGVYLISIRTEKELITERILLDTH